MRQSNVWQSYKNPGQTPRCECIWMLWRCVTRATVVSASSIPSTLFQKGFPNTDIIFLQGDLVLMSGSIVCHISRVLCGIELNGRVLTIWYLRLDILAEQCSKRAGQKELKNHFHLSYKIWTMMFKEWVISYTFKCIMHT